jgi:c-di-GMP-binding flagellar brake protein YcgR
MKSCLEHVEKHGNVVLLLPIYQGKRVMLARGAIFEVTFYTKSGPYRSIGVVKECFNEDRIHFVRVHLTTAFFRIQRRLHYRMECFLDAEVYEIPEEEREHLDQKHLHSCVMDPDVLAGMQRGVIVDISGGGIRFVCGSPHEVDDILMVHFIIKNEHVHQDLLVPVSVVTCGKAGSDSGKYEHRAAFLHLTHHLREMIIKYIFYEERRNRSKGRVR